MVKIQGQNHGLHEAALVLSMYRLRTTFATKPVLNHLLVGFSSRSDAEGYLCIVQSLTIPIIYWNM